MPDVEEDGVTLKAWMWFLASMAAYLLGSITSKSYGMRPTDAKFAIAVLAFSLTAAFWMPAMRIANEIIVLGMIWAVAYVAIDTAVGLGFGERLTAAQWAGFAMGMASMVLLGR